MTMERISTSFSVSAHVVRCRDGVYWAFITTGPRFARGEGATTQAALIDAFEWLASLDEDGE